MYHSRTLSVIPVKTGIQSEWIPHQARDDGRDWIPHQARDDKKECGSPIRSASLSVEDDGRLSVEDDTEAFG